MKTDVLLFFARFQEYDLQFVDDNVDKESE